MMTKNIEGKIQGRSKRIGIVVSKFNEFITQRLLDGCLDELRKLGVNSSNITVIWVPGSFEIPVVALKLAKKKNIDAVICLGCVIRGDTYHFELVADTSAFGIAQVSLQTQKPVIFGILSTNNTAQAKKRSEKKGDNKGREAASAALEMADLLSQLSKK